MKKIKKSLAIILMLSLAATLFAVPTVAMANEIDGLTWTAPAGYVNASTTEEGPFSYVLYRFADGSIIQAGSFIQHGVNSVHAKTDMEWLDFIEEYYFGYQYMHANMLARFETIGDYEYVKITYGPEIGGIRYYNTLYIGGPGCDYAFLAQHTDASKPYDAALLALVQSVQYGGAAPAPAPVDNTIKIYVNGNRIYSDADPVIINGRTLVPIRAVAEAMGCTVSWNGNIRTVSIARDGLTVDLIIDDTLVLKMWSGGYEEIEADVPAQIIKDRTFVPVRVVSEAFGAKVDWDGNTRSVNIYTGGVG